MVSPTTRQYAMILRGLSLLRKKAKPELAEEVDWLFGSIAQEMTYTDRDELKRIVSSIDDETIEEKK